MSLPMSLKVKLSLGAVGEVFKRRDMLNDVAECYSSEQCVSHF